MSPGAALRSFSGLGGGGSDDGPDFTGVPDDIESGVTSPPSGTNLATAASRFVTWMATLDECRDIATPVSEGVSYWQPVGSLRPATRVLLIPAPQLNKNRQGMQWPVGFSVVNTQLQTQHQMDRFQYAATLTGTVTNSIGWTRRVAFGHVCVLAAGLNGLELASLAGSFFQMGTGMPHPIRKRLPSRPMAIADLSAVPDGDSTSPGGVCVYRWRDGAPGLSTGASNSPMWGEQCIDYDP